MSQGEFIILMIYGNPQSLIETMKSRKPMGTHPHYFGDPFKQLVNHGFGSSQRHACLSVDQHFYTTEDEWSNTSIYIIKPYQFCGSCLYQMLSSLFDEHI